MIFDLICLPRVIFIQQFVDFNCNMKSLMYNENNQPERTRPFPTLEKLKRNRLFVHYTAHAQMHIYRNCKGYPYLAGNIKFFQVKK